MLQFGLMVTIKNKNKTKQGQRRKQSLKHHFDRVGMIVILKTCERNMQTDTDIEKAHLLLATRALRV